MDMTPRLHPSVAGFDRAADAYERARPEYPDPLLDWLVEQLGLAPGASVLDVGAGTGKLTRPLLDRGLRVIAVEPIAGMRAALAATAPGADVREGVAEALPVEDAGVDAVVAGQAFHWFADERALAQFARVLRPAGRLGLMWNARDLDQPLQRQVDDIVRGYATDAPRHASGAWEQAFTASSGFVRAAERRLDHRQALTPDGLVDRVLSTSFMAALPEDDQAAVARRVRALAGADEVQLAYTAEAFVYARAAG
jgi:SAM-dependent methyltransferase